MVVEAEIDKVDKFKASYDKFKGIRAAYLAKNCIDAYLIDAKINRSTLSEVYFLYRARKDNKPTIAMGVSIRFMKTT